MARGHFSSRWIPLAVILTCLTGFAPSTDGAPPADRTSDRIGGASSYPFGLDVNEINKRLPKGRVVRIEPPLSESAYVLPPGVPATGNLARLPAGVPIVHIEVPSDEMSGRGQAASTAGAADQPEAIVFLQSADSGFFFFTGADQGNFLANQLSLANGFEPGDSITSYDLLVFNDPLGGPATVKVSLWDGDPLGTVDVECAEAGIPQPIPGTGATFTNLPAAEQFCPAITGTQEPSCVGLFRLNASLSRPVTIGCDPVWLVMEVSEGCRLGWRLSGATQQAGLFEIPPQVGFSDYIEWRYDCGLDNDCDTLTGGNAGFCCDSGEACDHTDAQTVNDCSGGLSLCTDGVAEYAGAFSFAGFGGYASMVASVRAPARATISLVPIGNDKDGGLDPGVTVDGNEITLPSGGRNVFFELRLGDWDPDDTGAQLRVYFAVVDPTGYATGRQGLLGPASETCDGPTAEAANAACEAAFGPGSLCEDPLGCDFTVPGECLCTAGFVDPTRPDHPFPGVLCFSDVRTPDYLLGCRPGVGAYDDPEPFPPDGMYGGTLVLRIPPNAEGTFTVGFQLPPASGIVMDNPHVFVAPLAVVPARITVLGCAVARPPTPEPSATSKNRYLSFVPSAAGSETALRVTFEDLPFPHDIYEGMTMWVGQPEPVSEAGGVVDPADAPAFSTFMSASLQCGRFFSDWTGSQVEPEVCAPNVAQPISSPEMPGGFGRAVSISGDWLIVGAFGDDDRGIDAGAAYMFRRSNSGTPSDPSDDAWIQQDKITASDASANDLFGSSVSISGDWAVVGAPWDDARRGAAYLFQRMDPGTPSDPGDDSWVEYVKLSIPAATGTEVGGAVAISGVWAIVGAERDDDRVGAAYVFRRDDNLTPLIPDDDFWVQQVKLTPSDGAGGRFGSSVAIADDRAVVGARFDNPSGGSSGSAYIFWRDENGTPSDARDDAWLQGAKLSAPDGAQTDHFGSSVGLSGRRIIVGANDDGNETLGRFNGHGSAYVFRRNADATPEDQGDDNWIYEAKLMAGRPAPMDHLGRSVAIEDDWAVVGGSGVAYVFRREERWVEDGRLVAPEGFGGNQPGRAVDISGGVIVAGETGVAYVLDLSACTDDGEPAPVGDGSIHVFHEMIVPGGTYLIQAVDGRCPTNVEANFSAPLEVTTSAWGDVCSPSAERLCEAGPDGSVDIVSDVLGVLNGFSNRPTAIAKARVDLEPATPDRLVTILDAVMAIDAFRGLPYPFGPTSTDQQAGFAGPCPR